MNVSEAAARVYARALFDIGIEAGTVGQIYDDLHAVHNALNGLDADLRVFFNLPQFRRDDKRRIINLAFEGKVSRPVLGLLNVLVEKRREPLLDNIVEEFDRYRDQHEERVRARVVTAHKLDDDLLAALQAALEQRTQKSVVLTETIDPEVLGGLRVNVGDRVLDGTLRRSLQDMRRALVAPRGRASEPAGGGAGAPRSGGAGRRGPAGKEHSTHGADQDRRDQLDHPPADRVLRRQPPRRRGRHRAGSR